MGCRKPTKVLKKYGNIFASFNFRNTDRSDSAVHNRALESISSHENLSDAFHDLYNAIEKLETVSLNKSSLISSSLSSFVPKKLIPSPTLGDLLHMNIT